MDKRTYRYFDGEVLYPFGYGLSYTQFTYRDARYANGEMTVTVENTGALDGDEVVQVYIKDHDAPFAVRNHSLCAVKRIHLAKGERTQITLPIRKEAFTAVDNEGKRVTQGRRFTLYVGGSQPDRRSAALLGQAPLSVDVTFA